MTTARRCAHHGVAPGPGPARLPSPEPTGDRLPRPSPTQPCASRAHLPLPHSGPTGPALIDEGRNAAACSGRGGGRAFPIGRKLRNRPQRARGQARSSSRNGAEGERASHKDRRLPAHAGPPHLVLDGDRPGRRAAIDAADAHLVVARGLGGSTPRWKRAIGDRRAVSKSVAVQACHGAASHRYVGVRERRRFGARALAQNGSDAKPTFTPPRPFEKGCVRNRPDAW